MKPAESPAAQPSIHIPPILLEGDEPSRPPVAGLGLKYAVGPAPAPPSEPETAELPEAYGTGRLLLTARDPRCVYAHWDITAEQQRHYNALSVHHHPVVRLHQDALGGRIATEVHLHPESRHWFLHVEQPGGRYVAELGYYQPDRQWRTIAVSEAVATPRETAATEKAVQFATLPPESPAPADAGPGAPTLVGLARPRAAEPPAGAQRPKPTEVGAPGLVSAGAQELTAPQAKAPPLRLPVEPLPWPFPPQPLPSEPADEYAGKTELPQPGAFPLRAEASRNGRPVAELILAAAGQWTPTQEHALVELLGQMLEQHEWSGSAEILELLHRQAERGISSAEAGQFEQAVALGEALGISSPLGGEQPAQKGFWFNVNAELVLYGATEPDAQVTIGGRAIRLRPDGTFSYRFALPDGTYALPLAARSTSGETRQAELQFRRSTRYEGAVAAHPQDPALKPPAAENVD